MSPPIPPVGNMVVEITDFRFFSARIPINFCSFFLGVYSIKEAWEGGPKEDKEGAAMGKL